MEGRTEEGRRKEGREERMNEWRKEGRRKEGKKGEINVLCSQCASSSYLYGREPYLKNQSMIRQTRNSLIYGNERSVIA
jgi:hypothetical protein